MCPHNETVHHTVKATTVQCIASYHIKKDVTLTLRHTHAVYRYVDISSEDNQQQFTGYIFIYVLYTYIYVLKKRGTTLARPRVYVKYSH